MKKISTHKSSFLFLFFLISAIPVFSQYNQWMWVKGDSTLNPQGSYGQPNIPSPTNNPKCSSGAAYWKDHFGNFWMLGGYSLTLVQAFWKYNPSSNTWTNIVPENGIFPPARDEAACWTDNNGDFWLYGGLGWNNSASIYGYLNDVWKYNVTTRLWTLINGNTTEFDLIGNYGVQGLATAYNKPHSRRLAKTWVDSNNTLWMFGGTSDWVGAVPTGWLNDLWKYEINTNMWTWVKGDSTINGTGYFGIKNSSSPINKPSARAGGNAWKDEFNNLWLYSGYGGAYGLSAHNDMWKYNINSNEWVWINGDSVPTIVHDVVYGITGVASPANKPAMMIFGFNWTDQNGNFWLFGGNGDTDQTFGLLGDTWKYDPHTNEWTYMNGNHMTNYPPVYGDQGIPASGNTPGSRYWSAGWVDDIGNPYVFGGSGVPPVTAPPGPCWFNDLWKLTLTAPVPVKLRSFTGKLHNENVFLNWKTEQETNLNHYEIERGFNGIDFEKLSEVKATNIKEYNSTDNVSKLEGKIVYYRLKMVDTDGKFIYSNVINFHIPFKLNFSLVPNPAQDYTVLKFSKELRGKADIEIRDIKGSIISKKSYNLTGNEIVIPTSHLSSGTYPFTIIYNNQRFIETIVIIH